MTYSYQTQNYYEPANQQVNYYNQSQLHDKYYEQGEPGEPIGNDLKHSKPSSAPAGLAGATVGALAGTAIGICQNPFIKNGVPTDKFAQQSYVKYLKKAPAAEKNSYGQFNEVINSLDKIKTPEELKNLFNSNPDASKELTTALNKSADEFLNGVTNRNISSNKKTIKSKLEAAIDTRYQNMKNEIERAWNFEKKRFVKPNDMDKNVFNAIRRAAVGLKASFVAKYAAVAGVIGGVLAYAGHKIYVNKKTAQHK